MAEREQPVPGDNPQRMAEREPAHEDNPQRRVAERENPVPEDNPQRMAEREIPDVIEIPEIEYLIRRDNAQREQPVHGDNPQRVAEREPPINRDYPQRRMADREQPMYGDNPQRRLSGRDLFIYLNGLQRIPERDVLMYGGNPQRMAERDVFMYGDNLQRMAEREQPFYGDDPQRRMADRDHQVHGDIQAYLLGRLEQDQPILGDNPMRRIVEREQPGHGDNPQRRVPHQVENQPAYLNPFRVAAGRRNPIRFPPVRRNPIRVATGQRVFVQGPANSSNGSNGSNPNQSANELAKRKRQFSFYIEEESKEPSEVPKRRNKLSDDLGNLLTSQRHCDIHLQVQDCTFPAHKAILASRSSVFAAMFKNEMSEKETGIVNIVDCEPDVFKVFLFYLYTAEINFKDCKTYDLYMVADKYDVSELKTACLDYLAHNLSVENVCECYVFGNLFEEVTLKERIQSFFLDNFKSIVISPAWISLMKEYSDLANELLVKMAGRVNQYEKFTKKLAKFKS